MTLDVLKRLVNEGGEYCGCCSTPDFRMWRVLQEREVEQCANCGDGAYDVYDLAENQQRADDACHRYLERRGISEEAHQREIGEWLDAQD